MGLELAFAQVLEGRRRVDGLQDPAQTGPPAPPTMVPQME